MDKNFVFPIEGAIGVFDSGVGGLSVLLEIRKTFPAIPIIYLADQLHVPYGSRPLQEVLDFSRAITKFLLSLGAVMIVVACNAASAAALQTIRKEFPQIPFVGMEPAVKPAAETTTSGSVGVLATPATFQGKLYASVVERFANNVKLIQSTCPGLVQQIELADFNSEQTAAILKTALQPMILQGIDTVVLGCTHYPFVISTIKNITGPKVRIINPAPAVARQTAKLYPAAQYDSTNNPVAQPSTLLITTGNSEDLAKNIDPAEWAK